MAGPTRTTATGSSRHEEYRLQPPRPANAWILYRSHQFAQIRQTNERVSQAEVSKRIAFMWKNEVESVKQYFEQMAEAEKLKHQQLYPDYRFCPQKKEDKLRSKEEMKQNRRAKKSKARDATPPDANANASTTPPSMSLPSMPRPYFVPSYPPNMVLQRPYALPYTPEAYYGPGGPSPPISAAPSPAPREASHSPCSDGNGTSSSSTPSIPPSSSSSSQASSTFSQLPANQFYFPSLPSSHQPSPNACVTQSLPLLFQSSPRSQLSLTPPQPQAPSLADNVVPAAAMWNNIHAPLPNFGSQNTEVVNYDIPADQVQDFTEFQQGVSGGSSSDSPLPMTDASSVFNLSHIDNANLVVPPSGDLEVAMGAQAQTVDYNEPLFAGFDFAGFRTGITDLTEAGLSSSQATSSFIQEDLQSLFRPPNNPEVQAYATARQRQSSVFAQDMMNFFNFEAAAGLVEDNSPATSTLPTTVAPQQVRLQNTQQAAAMPIFTQMTNTSTAASSSSYVPPSGAIYSSTRRVGGSWKPSFANSSQTEDPIHAWTRQTR